MSVELLERPCDTNADVESLLREKLEIFDSMCALSGIVEIDGVTEDGNIKIINHSNQEAYEASINTIVNTQIKDLMLALETGVHIKLFGVTRIVGYYSRVSNWNKSKIGELEDRHKGNYSVKNENSIENTEPPVSVHVRCSEGGGLHG